MSELEAKAPVATVRTPHGEKPLTDVLVYVDPLGVVVFQDSHFSVEYEVSPVMLLVVHRNTNQVIGVFKSWDSVRLAARDESPEFL